MSNPRREFFWSARTLRCDLIGEEDGIPTRETEDVLGVDHMRSVYAHEPYSDLIVRLLNEHFEKETA